MMVGHTDGNRDIVWPEPILTGVELANESYT
jgi:hypothetical protein